MPDNSCSCKRMYHVQTIVQNQTFTEFDILLNRNIQRLFEGQGLACIH